MNKYQENLEALDNARLTINKLCGKWLPREVLDNLEEYGDYELYNYVKYSVFKELVDKETPKKYKIKTDKDGRTIWVCPKCNETLVKFWSEVETVSHLPYCYMCGQKLDWREE